jgi:hypothetical protein
MFNQEASFPNNLVLNDEIVKKISILKTCQSKKKNSNEKNEDQIL